MVSVTSRMGDLAREALPTDMGSISIAKICKYFSAELFWKKTAREIIVFKVSAKSKKYLDPESKKAPAPY